MKKGLLLAVDIGNTNISLGLFKANKLLSVRRLITSAKISPYRYEGQLRKIFSGIKKEEIEGIIISSVVPKALKSLRASLKRIFNLRPLIVGQDIKSGIKNLYRRPKQVGQDRLVNARAAYEIYKQGCIIVDFGTAITIDVVNQKKEYLGGLIVPGLEISLETLAERAVLLPRLKLSKVKNLIGKDTKESMLSGIFYGFGSLCDGVAAKFKAKLKKDLLVVATGGQSPAIKPYCLNLDVFRPHLTLEGLKIIYKDRKKQKP